MRLLDCTLRDGANVVGNGFSRELTTNIINGLFDSGIRTIEFGNCRGLSAETALGSKAPLTDRDYLTIAADYVEKGNLGMFQMASCANKEDIHMAAEYGLTFLRVGNDAGEGEKSLHAIEMVKESDLFCRYSLMKAYVLTPEELAKEAEMLVNAGADSLTIMDSAGTMLPNDAAAYVKAVKARVTVPVGFHGHSNLGLSQANALAAVEAGAEEIDCGLIGMARSAGNCATELIVAALQRKGALKDVNLFQLLSYLEHSLIPQMKCYGYQAPVQPIDVVLGITGCHSSFLKEFRNIAEENQVDLYQLIAETSKLERKKPGSELIERIAAELKHA